ncbi:MAG: Ig-like domain-containing protein [Candidatus Muiribacteriota bacterium]
MAKKTIFLFVFLCLFINIFSAIELSTYVKSNSDNNNGYYKNDDSEIILEILDNDNTGSSGTITISPAIGGLPSEADIADADNDGKYLIVGYAVEGENPVNVSQLSDGIHTVTVSIAGSTNSPQSIDIVIDSTSPSFNVESLTTPYEYEGNDYFRDGSEITVQIRVEDANLDENTISFNFQAITGNSAHSSLQPDSFNSSTNIATWNITGGDVTDGEKTINGTVFDLADNEGQFMPSQVVLHAVNTPMEDEVILSEPGNDVYINDNRPTFSWQKPGGNEIEYVLELARNSSFTQSFQEIEITGGDTLDHTMTSDLESGINYWRMYARDMVEQESPVSETRHFYIDTDPPLITSVTSFDNSDPDNDSDHYAAGTVVRLEANEDSSQEYNGEVNIYCDETGYNHTYNLEYEAVGTYYYLWNTSSVETGDYTITFSLEDEAGNIAENSDLSVRIEADAPGKVSLVSPVNGGVIQTLNPQFVWESLTEDVQHYHLEVSENINFSSNIISETFDSNTTSYTSTHNFSENITHYWRVYAEDIVGNTAPGQADIWEFKCDITAPQFVSSSPSDGAEDVSTSTNIEIIMNEELLATSVDESSVIFEAFDGDSFEAFDIDSYEVDYSYSDAESKISIQPDNNMQYNVEHRITLNTQIEDLAGNNLEEDAFIDFVTRPLSAVSNVYAYDKEQSVGESIIVTWDLINDPVVDNYLVYYKENTHVTEGDIGTIATFYEVDSSTDELQIDGLTEGQSYYVAVVAKTTYDTYSELTSDSTYGPVTPVHDAEICRGETKAEITPSSVPPDAEINYSLFLKPVFFSTDVGFDKIYIGIDKHQLFDFSNSEFIVDGNSWTREASPDGEQFSLQMVGDTVEITLGQYIDREIINNNTIEFNFVASPDAQLEETCTFSVMLEHTELDINTHVQEGQATSSYSPPHTLTVSIVEQIQSLKAEINPHYLKLEEIHQLSLNILPEFEEGNVGFDSIIMEFPASYSIENINSWELYNGPNLLSDSEFEINGDTVEIKIPLEINSNSSNKELRVDFYTETPLQNDLPEGSDFSVWVNHSQMTNPIEAEAGNADSHDGTNNDSLTVFSSEPALDINSEVQPYVTGIDSRVNFSFFIQQVSNADCAGVDKYVINIPPYFTDVQIEDQQNRVGIGADGKEYNIITSGLPQDNEALVNINQPSTTRQGTVEVEIGEKHRQNNGTFEVQLTMNTPGESGDYVFDVWAGNRHVDDLIKATANDVDDDPGNNNPENALQIYTTAPAKEAHSELTPYVIKPGDTKEFKLYTRFSTAEMDSGVDKINIKTAGLDEFDVSPENTTVEVDFIEYETIDTGEVENNEVLIEKIDDEVVLTFGAQPFKGNNILFTIEFEGTALNELNYPEGAGWEVFVDNKNASHPVESGVANLDGDDLNDNSLYLYITRTLNTANAVAEIAAWDALGNPHFDNNYNAVKAGSVNNNFQYTIKPEYTQTDIGINEIMLGVPNQENIEITYINAGGTSFNIINSGYPAQNEALVTYEEQYDSGIEGYGGTVEIRLGRRLYYNNPADSRILVEFVSDAAQEADDGVQIEAELDYTYLEDEVNVIPGDAEAPDESTQSLTITTLQSPVDLLTSEINPVNLKPGDTSKKFTLTFIPEIVNVNSGFNKAVIEVPDSFSNIFVESENEPVKRDGVPLDIVSSNPNADEAVIYVHSGNVFVEYALLHNAYTGIEFEIEFYANAPSSSDLEEDGSLFSLFVDNTDDSLPVYSSTEMPVVTAAVVDNPPVAELTAESHNGLSFPDINGIIAGSDSNKITLTMLPDITDSCRGINNIKVNMPAGYEIPNPNLSTLMVGDDDLTGSTNFELYNGSRGLNITFLPELNEQKQIVIELTVNAPAGDVKNSVEVFVDNTEVGNGDDFAVKAVSGNAYAEVNTNSLSLELIEVPARGADAQIDNNLVFPSKNVDFNLYILPDITVDDGGIDKALFYIPSGFNEVNIKSVRWGGTTLSTSQYEVIKTSSYIEVESDIRITEEVTDKQIIISFSALTPDKVDVPDGKLFTGYISNTDSDINVVFVEGNAEPLQPENSLVVRTRSVVDRAIAEIEPPYLIRGTSGETFDYYLDLSISEYASGVDKVKISLSDVLSDIGSVEFYTKNPGEQGETQYSIIENGDPQPGEIKYTLNNSIMEFEFNSVERLEEDKIIRVRFMSDVPNINIVDDNKSKIYDNGNEIEHKASEGNANEDSSSWNTWTISTASAQVEDAVLKAEELKQGKWKIIVELDFNTRVDTQGPTPNVELDGNKASMISFSNVESHGYYKGYVWLETEEFTGELDIDVSNLRDSVGNWVESSILSHEVIPNAGVGFFRNPLSQNLYNIVFRMSSPLPTGYSLGVEVQEAGFGVENLELQKGDNNRIYSGNYKIRSTPNLTVNFEILDNNDETVNSGNYSMGTLYAPYNYSPEKGFVLKGGETGDEVTLLRGPNLIDIAATIPQELQKTDEQFLIENGLEISDIQINRDFNTEGYYVFDGKKWLPAEMIQTGLTIYAVAKLRDESPPIISNEIKYSSGGDLIIEVEDESFIKKADIYNETEKIKSIIKDNKIIVDQIQVKYSTIKVEVKDYRGNKSARHFDINKAVASSGIDINIYPNPASDYVVFDIDYSGTYDLEIYDAGGRTVYRARNLSNTYLWDLRDKRAAEIADGTYIYRVIYDNNEKNGRVAVLK